MSPVRKPPGAPPPPPPPDHVPGGYPPPPPPPPPPPRRKRKQSPTEKLKRKIAKVTGIPTTSSGRKRKAEHVVSNFLIDQLDKIDKKK